MTTGNRCVIFDKINALDQLRTVPELVAALKPILNELAYYSVTSDGSVLEAREEWHTEFTGHLQADERASSAARAAASGPPARVRTSERARDEAPPARVRTSTRAHEDAPRARQQIAAAPGLSSNLRSIMNGSHASFRD